MALIHNDAAKLSASILFVIMFELGPGPICWFYMSEVMNEKGVAVGTFINWTFTLIFSISTPLLFSHLGQNTFFIYAVLCGISFLFILIFVQETKGLNATQLMNLYRPEQYKLEPLRETTSTE